MKRQNTPSTSVGYVKPQFKQVRTSAGYVLKVYPVPQNLIWGAKPKWSKPVLPVHEMKTATGSQTRAAKEGDAEWITYAAEAQLWEDEQNDIQNDLQLVLCLRDFKWPEKLEPPEYLRVAIDAGLIDWPSDDDNMIKQRAQYVRAVVAPLSEDVTEINHAVMELTGVPLDLIEEFKAKFRDNLRGTIRDAMEASTDEGAGEDDSQRGGLGSASSVG
jgi:hypothetical protein